MKQFLLAVLIFVGAYFAYMQMQTASQREPDVPQATEPATAPSITPSTVQVSHVFDQRHSGQQVRGSGTVARILSDDNDGSRHQRFILEMSSGQTLLIAHNIDLAPRISSIRTGDRVSFYGEYEWNSQGGVVHWTHHDPQGRHVGGWLEHAGRRYQ